MDYEVKDRTGATRVRYDECMALATARVAAGETSLARAFAWAARELATLRTTPPVSVTVGDKVETVSSPNPRHREYEQRFRVVTLEGDTVSVYDEIRQTRGG